MFPVGSHSRFGTLPPDNSVVKAAQEPVDRTFRVVCLGAGWLGQGTHTHTHVCSPPALASCCCQHRCVPLSLIRLSSTFVSPPCLPHWVARAYSRAGFIAPIGAGSSALLKRSYCWMFSIETFKKRPYKSQLRKRHAEKGNGKGLRHLTMKTHHHLSD